MTFMEIMIVISIIALVSSSLIMGFATLGHVRLRSSAYMLAAAFSRAMSLATSRNESVRIVVDIDKNTIGFEIAEGKLLIDRKNPEGENPEDGEDNGGKKSDEESVEFRKEGDKKIEENEVTEKGGKFDLGVNTLGERIKAGFHEGEVPKYKAPQFKPVGDRILNEIQLEGGTRFFAVYSQLFEGEKKEGKVYIYFTPDGTADHVAVQLRGQSGEIFTVEMTPQRAKPKIYDYPYVPDFSLDEESEE